MILNEFKEDLRSGVPNFAAKVAPVYLILNWKWKPINRVPSYNDIKKTLYELIDDVKMGRSIGTGGLMVGIDDINHESFLSFSINDEKFYSPIDFD